MRPRQAPPGPSDPGAGRENLRRLREDPEGFLRELVGRYGDVVQLSAGDRRICLLGDPEHIQQVFSTESRAFRKPEAMKASNRGYWGDGLTTLEGEAWRARRRLMQPVFHRAEIAKHAPAIVACTRDLIASWHPDAPIHLARAALALVTRIAARTVLDADLDAPAGAEGGGPAPGRELLPAREARGVEYTVPLLQDEHGAVPNVRPRAARRMPRTVELVEARVASEDARDDMLASLLDRARRTGCPLSTPDALGEAMQLLFAGHLNTPRALEAIWSALADHADVAQQVSAEIDEVLAGRAPERDDLTRMPYGEMVIKEAMRVNTPSGPSLQREAVEQVEIGGYSIDPGTLVWVDLHLIHHDPRWFEEPERFWPERFGKDRLRRSPRQAFLAFGAGPRTCIGLGFSMMELQLILAVVCQSCRLIWAGAGAERSHLRAVPRRVALDAELYGVPDGRPPAASSAPST